MRNWLRDHFLPHQGNEQKPQLLRSQAAILLFVLVLFLELGFFLRTSVDGKLDTFFAAVLPSVLVDKTNEVRISERVGLLKQSPALEVAAIAKAKDMAKKGYFAHTSPDGVSPWSWIKGAGYTYSHAGENLAINFTDSRDVVDAWLASPRHRANLLNGKYTEIGIATAEGVYEGRDAIFIVQFFGRPARPKTRLAEKDTDTINISPSGGKSVLENRPIVSEAVVLKNTQAIAVKGEIDENFIAETTGSTVSMLTPYATISQKIFANPKMTLTTLFSILAAAIFAALLFMLALNTRIVHPKLIANGILLLVLIDGFFLLNDYLTLARSSIE
ncbi:MAG: CAP domain-containing protein [Patescibacteria group bacterium]